MCRNIRVLFYFEPPTTPDEIQAAALQYVRKVSGMTKPAQANQAAFDRAVERITQITTKLLDDLEPTPRAEPRTREGEVAKARAKWQRREIAARALRDR